MKLKKMTKKLLPFFILIVTIFSAPRVLAESDELWDAVRNQIQPMERPFGSYVDPRIVVANVLRYFLSLVGIIFLAYIVYAGFTWMTAGGNEEKINRAKSTLKTGIIGIAIIILAFSIARFVVVAARCATDVSGAWCAFLNELVW